MGLWNEEKKDEGAKKEDDKENKSAESNHDVEQAVSKICMLLFIENYQTPSNCTCRFRLLDCHLKIQY